MELGATYCSPAGSGIEENDPLNAFYASTQLGVAIGHSVFVADNSVKVRIEKLIALKAIASDENKSRCRLCDHYGVSTAFYDVTDRITAALSTPQTAPNSRPEELFAISGHAAMPISPPKKNKREEVLAVAVICLKTPMDNEGWWLMVKRPSTGLLAGQWEFPSVCIWDSVQGSKQKYIEGSKSHSNSSEIDAPPVNSSVMSAVLDSYLSDVLQSKTNEDNTGEECKTLVLHVAKKRVKIEVNPIVHIFSHVVHTMWIEYGECYVEQLDYLKRWVLNNGQEAGWLTESDMNAVGVTSGVRKVLAATQQCRKA